MSPAPAIKYVPDFAAPPGDLIQECIDARGMSARALARLCGRSGKLMAEIIAGKAPVEPETALQLERVLGVSATIWTNMEAAHKLQQARDAENEALAVCYEWASTFPLKDLSERGYLERTSAKPQQVKEVLKFFGVGTVKACEERIAELLDSKFRTTAAFETDNLALAAWLRAGEIQAKEIETEDYDAEAFLRALKEIRELTVLSVPDILDQIRDRCASAGVAFVLEPPLPKLRASGVSRWLTPRKALIQQSLRHRSNDHFWFTFFHECAHLLLHSKKAMYIEMKQGPGTGNPNQEAEANVWAAEMLVPSAALRTFIPSFGGTADEVRAFAAICRVAPGIIVGQLQHQKVVGYGSPLSKLVERYTWTE